MTAPKHRTTPKPPPSRPKPASTDVHEDDSRATGPTTPSSSVAATTAWSTAPTSRSPACKTLILERRHLVGGAAITEELRPGLLVHDVLVRAEPAAAGHHPRARADQARLHAAADVDDVRARRRRATTCWFTQDHDENLKEIARHSKHDADAYEQYSHDIEMVCQAIKPLLDMVPPDIFSDDPEELIALASARLALPQARQARRSTTPSAC